MIEFMEKIKVPNPKQKTNKRDRNAIIGLALNIRYSEIYNKKAVVDAKCDFMKIW